MSDRLQANWLLDSLEDYDSKSYEWVLGLGEQISEYKNISMDEIYIVPAKNHSLKVGTRDEMNHVQTLPSNPKSLSDIKNYNGELLMHLSREERDIDPSPPMSQGGIVEEERSSNEIWLTTEPDNMVLDATNPLSYEHSSETDYEAKLHLTDHPLEEKTIEDEVDSLGNTIRKILGREPETKERTEVVESGFKGTIISIYPETKEIVESFYTREGELETNW